MRLLVTGACGFVGSCLVRGLVEVLPGLEVTGLDSFIREGSRGNVAPLQRLGVRIVEGDVRNEADLESAGPADWVIDCAAEPSVLAGVTGPTSSFGVMDHNLVGTIRTLEFCRRHQAGLVLLSTSRVYSITVLAQLPLEIHAGRFRPMPHGLEGIRGLGPHGIAEDFSTDPPLSLYGVSKRCAELVAQEYADAFGFPLWINRCIRGSSVTGVGPGARGVPWRTSGSTDRDTRCATASIPGISSPSWRGRFRPRRRRERSRGLRMATHGSIISPVASATPVPSPNSRPGAVTGSVLVR